MGLHSLQITVVALNSPLRILRPLHCKRAINIYGHQFFLKVYSKKISERISSSYRKDRHGEHSENKVEIYISHYNGNQFYRLYKFVFDRSVK